MGFRFKWVGEGQTPEGRPFFTNEYRGGNFDNVERVAYVQLPDAVAYVVFAARGDSSYAAHVAALLDAVQSLRYRPEYIQPDSSEPGGE